MKRLSLIVVLLLLLVAPVTAQSVALVADGASYAPVQFLPDDLRQSVAVDTPGYTTLQGIGCVKLSPYANHLNASLAYDADEKLVQLKWGGREQPLNFYLLPGQHGLDLAWGVRDLRHRGDQPKPGGQSMKAAVARVIDGDTVELANGERLRYIGVDTPEMNASDPTQRGLAESAKRVNRGLVEGRELTVELGVEQRDHYGRLLGYVWADGVFVNGALMAGGFAQVMTIAPNVQHAEYFRALGAQAREANRGLWRVEAAAAQPQPSQVQQAPQPQTTGGGTVYVTDTGKKYHRGNCRYLRQSKHPMSLQAAKAAGNTPCKVCKPPQ
jgi:micrococcal nuclease